MTAIARDARFDEQRARFRFHFCCESCAYFEPGASDARDGDPSGEGRCTFGYPTAAHREARYRDATASLIFCKSFEYGAGDAPLSDE
ncbi:MAG: hypothetical protein AB7S26_06430 [Sandaracinaceae bacterium]